MFTNLHFWSNFSQKMYYLTVFKHFVSIFSEIFDPTDPLFIDFRSSDPSFLQNLQSD